MSTPPVPTDAPAPSASELPAPEYLFDGRLLLAIDGSPSADGAMAVMAELRRLRERQVTVLAVFEPAPMPVPTVDPSLATMTTMAGDEGLKTEFFRRVERQVARCFQGLPPLALERTEGSPVRVIVDLAHEREMDLVITGLRGHGLIDRLVGDETALRVTRATDRPVLAVSPTLTHLPRHGVVGIDFSRASLRAAHAAAGLIAPGGTVTLVHARPTLDVAAAAEDGIDMPYARGVTAALDGLRTIVAGAHPGITVAVDRRDGDAADAVLNYALANNADFVAVGRHRRNAIAHAVLGSVATSLLRAAKISVLVIPPARGD